MASIKPITESDLESIAENLSCNNPIKFQEQLAKKGALQQISKIPGIKIINTEKTIRQKTNFPYIIYHEKEFYFVRIDSGKIAHRKKIIKEKNKLEKTLGINPKGIIYFNPLTLSPKKAIKIIKKRPDIKLIDLRYNQNSLSELMKNQDLNIKNNLTADLIYHPKKRYWRQRKKDEKEVQFHYCIGENLSPKQKRKRCEIGFKKKFSKKCKNCDNYKSLIEESTKPKTKNKFNQQAILYLKSLKKIQPDEKFEMPNTELSNLAQKIL